MEGGIAGSPPLPGQYSGLPRGSSGISTNGVNSVANAASGTVGTVAGPLSAGHAYPVARVLQMCIQTSLASRFKKGLICGR